MDVVKIQKCIDSDEYYSLNKKLHRLNHDKPACIFWDGYREWCRNGHYWRENGFAVIYRSGRGCLFFKDGIEK